VDGKVGAVMPPATRPAARKNGGTAGSGAAMLARGRRWARLNHRMLRAYVLGPLAIIAFVALWDYLSVHQVVFYVRFNNVPTPAQVLARAVLAFSSGTFLIDMVISSRRIAVGFALATAIAVPLGMLMGRFRLIGEIVFPIAEVLRPIPAIAWVPMSIMIWPTTEESIVFITFLGSFFPILINTLHGMATVDPVLVRAARCLGAGEKSLFFEVFLPGALPDIFTGLTVGMGVAWVSLIAAEMIAGQYGIGYFTWEAYSLIQYGDIALGMIAIGVMGLLSSGAILLIGRALMPWGHHRAGGPS
jgi:NitT/TauT family transport system permease protein